jgi:hypothetical protein
MEDSGKTANELLLLAVEKGYRVTREGVALGPTGAECNRVNSSGYVEFWIKGGDAGNGNVPVHRVQAYQKFGEGIFQLGLEVRHLDGNPLNNAEENIGLGTHSENMMDQPRRIRVEKARVAAKARRKLTEAEVWCLREDRKNGATYDELMKKYGIAKGTVSYIVNRRTYAG